MLKFILLTVILSFLHVGHTVTNEKFSWLEGTWEMKKANGSSRLEVWKRKDERILTGEGLSVRGQDSVLLESIELAYRENEYWYIPTVPDQNNAIPVSFRLVREEENMYTFENPDHDFPQRIIYHLKPLSRLTPYQASIGDTLLARVETLDRQGMNFQFFRI